MYTFPIRHALAMLHLSLSASCIYDVAAQQHPTVYPYSGMVYTHRERQTKHKKKMSLVVFFLFGSHSSIQHYCMRIYIITTYFSRVKNLFFLPCSRSATKKKKTKTTWNSYMKDSLGVYMNHRSAHHASSPSGWSHIWWWWIHPRL